MGSQFQESNTRVAEINGRNERQCIGKQASFACLESRMEADLVVTHASQRLIHEEATNTGAQKMHFTTTAKDPA